MVRIHFYLKEIFCFNWHRIRFVYKSAGSKQLCTIKIAVYLGVSNIQNTNLGQLCSLYCKASILKVFNPLTPRDFMKNTKISPYFFKWILTYFRFAFIYTNPYITWKIKLQILQIRQNNFICRYHGNEKVFKTVIFVFFRYLLCIFPHSGQICLQFSLFTT